MIAAALIGLPYAVPCNPPQTYDCWALATHVRDMMGRSTPSCVQSASERTQESVALLSDPDMSVWKQLDAPVEGCFVGFGTPATHCGVYLDRKVIHAHSTDGQTGSVKMHDLNLLERLCGKMTFWEVRDAND